MVSKGKNGASYTACFVPIKHAFELRRSFLDFQADTGEFPGENTAMKTVLLLIGSNVFMTLAWYGQLRFKWFEGKPLWLVILACWGIALFEYCLMVPANRIGYSGGSGGEGAGGGAGGTFSGYQLKIIQEAITLGVFVVFARLVLKEEMRWNHGVCIGLILLAVYFATGFGPGRGSTGQ
jgi:uncharacterized protein (DUF486 family)